MQKKKKAVPELSWPEFAVELTPLPLDSAGHGQSENSAASADLRPQGTCCGRPARATGRSPAHPGGSPPRPPAPPCPGPPQTARARSRPGCRERGAARDYFPRPLGRRAEGSRSEPVRRATRGPGSAPARRRRRPVRSSARRPRGEPRRRASHGAAPPHPPPGAPPGEARGPAESLAGGRGGRVGVGACGAAGCRARGAAGRRAEGPAASPGGVSLRPRGALTTVCFNETPPGRERPESLSAALLVRQRPGREPVPPGRGAGVAHIPRSGRTGEGGLLRPARGPHAPCVRDVSASGQTISVP